MGLFGKKRDNWEGERRVYEEGVQEGRRRERKDIEDGLAPPPKLSSLARSTFNIEGPADEVDHYLGGGENTMRWKSVMERIGPGGVCGYCGGEVQAGACQKCSAVTEAPVLEMADRRSPDNDRRQADRRVADRRSSRRKRS